MSRVEPVALAERGLLVAQPANLARGIEAEADDHEHRGAQARHEARNRGGRG
jgi:hypothetical protein